MAAASGTVSGDVLVVIIQKFSSNIVPLPPVVLDGGAVTFEVTLEAGAVGTDGGAVELPEVVLPAGAVTLEVGTAGGGSVGGSVTSDVELHRDPVNQAGQVVFWSALFATERRKIFSDGAAVWVFILMPWASARIVRNFMKS